MLALAANACMMRLGSGGMEGPAWAMVGAKNAAIFEGRWRAHRLINFPIMAKRLGLVGFHWLGSRRFLGHHGFGGHPYRAARQGGNRVRSARSVVAFCSGLLLASRSQHRC